MAAVDSSSVPDFPLSGGESDALCSVLPDPPGRCGPAAGSGSRRQAWRDGLTIGDGGHLTPLRKGVLACLLQAAEAAQGGTDREIASLLRAQGTPVAAWAEQALLGWPAPPVPAGGRLRCSCLINNCNYRRYVGEAVESALAQTLPFDEIILVDDGSSDGSQAMLRERYGSHPRVRLVFQANGGQLAAFHAGLASSTGDLLFFLDADDRFLPTKAAEVAEVFQAHPDCGMVCHPVVLFGTCDGVDLARRPERPMEILRMEGPDPWSCFPSAEDPVIPLGAGQATLQDWWKWVGSSTSGMVFSRRALAGFLPLPEPLVPLWRLRADECLMLGLHFSGEARFYLHRPLTEYRVHDANGFFNRAEQEDEARRRAVLLLREELLKRLVPGGMWRCWSDRRKQPFHALKQAWSLPREARLDPALRRRLRLGLLARILRLGRAC